MKVKLNLYISNPEAFARDPQSHGAYALLNGRWMDKDWIFAGEVEFSIDVDTKTVLDAAQDDITAEIGKHTAAINILEQRKAELLALPAPESS